MEEENNDISELISENDYSESIENIYEEKNHISNIEDINKVVQEDEEELQYSIHEDDNNYIIGIGNDELIINSEISGVINLENNESECNENSIVYNDKDKDKSNSDSEKFILVENENVEIKIEENLNKCFIVIKKKVLENCIEKKLDYDFLKRKIHRSIIKMFLSFNIYNLYFAYS